MGLIIKMLRYMFYKSHKVSFRDIKLLQIFSEGESFEDFYILGKD